MRRNSWREKNRTHSILENNTPILNAKPPNPGPEATKPKLPIPCFPNLFFPVIDRESRHEKSWHHSSIAANTNSTLMLVGAHVFMLLSLVLATTSAESAVTASLTILVARATVAVARAAIAKARALAGHAVAATAISRDSERVAVRRCRSGLSNKSRSRECSGGRSVVSRSREIRSIALLSRDRSRK